jgi:predicted ATP-binding protein involved in virulence
VSDTGYGIPSVINKMIVSRNGSVEQLEKDASELIHGFKRVYVDDVREVSYVEEEPLRINNQVIQQKVMKKRDLIYLDVEFEGKGKIKADQLSEGTLLILAILTILHSPNKPNLILLDDIDRALHPQAQIDLIQAIKKILENHPDLQIICTSHSPLVVSQCSKKEVIKLKFDSNKYAKLDENEYSPLVLNNDEILKDYFDVQDHAGISEMMQKYGLLANDPYRTDEDEQEIQRILSVLAKFQVKIDWKPVKRKNQTKAPHD